MKVTIDENGTLMVQSETELEGFALKQWSDDYFSNRNFSTILINSKPEPSVDILSSVKATINGIRCTMCPMSETCKKTVQDSGCPPG